MTELIQWLRSFDVIKVSIAFSVLMCFNAIVYVLITHEIPDANREILIHSLGIIEGVITTMAAFYWGSSVGSKQKTDAMSRMMRGDGSESPAPEKNVN